MRREVEPIEEEKKPGREHKSECDDKSVIPMKCTVGKEKVSYATLLKDKQSTLPEEDENGDDHDDGKADNHDDDNERLAL